MDAVTLVIGALLGAGPLVYALILQQRTHKAERHSKDLTAQLLVAETKVRKQEALDAIPKHSDPLVNKWFARALRALPPAGALLISNGLAAEQLYADSDGPRPDSDAQPMPYTPTDSLIRELK